MNKLKELEQKYKELGEEIERLKNQGKAWKPEEDDVYYCVYPNGCTEYHTWRDDEYDIGVYEIGNCFETEEEAEAVVEKLKIYTQLKRLAEEINTEPIDWENDKQQKYFIEYDFCCGDLFMGAIYQRQHIGQIYCTNIEFYNIAKEHIGEENLLKLFKE